MALSMKPLADRVIVRAAAAEEKTKSGIIIPDTAKEKPQRGEVVAVGEGKTADSGSLIKPQVSFSSRSPVRFTPIMLAAPPALNWLEIPPPFGFWASTTRASRKHTIRMRMMSAVYMKG